MGNPHTHLTAAEIEQYCHGHIEKLDIQPIVKEAYLKKLLSAETTYIHLRLAEQKEQKENGTKPYITQEAIAAELNFYQNRISDFSQNDLMGITPNIFVKLGIIRNWNKILDILEEDNYTVELANFVNSYLEQHITDKSLHKRKAYTLLNTDVSPYSPDACRKILNQLFESRIIYTSKLSDENANIEDVTITISSLSFNKGKYKYTLAAAYHFGKDNAIEETYECLKKELVHSITSNIHKKVKMYIHTSSKNQEETDTNETSTTSDKQYSQTFYLSTTESNRKVKYALKYIAFDKPYIKIII